ncbi:MAG TPA: hypothetical protein VI485_28190 [Vicinamibacterales bacterium]|nr:hypothetical protein [Vicinamibacterales bacterium]
MTLQLRSVAIILVTGLMCDGSVVFAQSAMPPRATQGLFGGVQPQADAPKRLDFTLSVIEGYDSDVPRNLQSRLDRNSLQSGGFSTMLNASAGYAWRGSRGQLGANLSSMVRHYAEVGETRSLGHAAGLGLTLRLPARVTLLVNQATAYSPTYLSGLFPSGAEVEPGTPGSTAPDYSVSDFESYTHTTTMTLKHDISSRSFVTGTGTFLYTDRLRNTDLWKDTNAYAYQGRYTHRAGRNSVLMGQYRYRSGKYGYTNEGTTTEIALNAGAEFIRPLSATRTAFARFNVGVSGADIPPQGVLGAGVLRRRYLGVADLAVGRQFGRTWQARADLRRGIEYLADLPTPVFADSLSAGVEGLLNRRVDLSLFAGYSSGESLLNSSSMKFDTYTGNVRLRYALSRSLAAYIEYLYYYYDFRGSTQLRAGVPSGLERSGVRAGLTLWVPALRR